MKDNMKRAPGSGANLLYTAMCWAGCLAAAVLGVWAVCGSLGAGGPEGVWRACAVGLLGTGAVLAGALLAVDRRYLSERFLKEQVLPGAPAYLRAGRRAFWTSLAALAAVVLALKVLPLFGTVRSPI